jgi:hypothetical protein
MRKLSLRVGGLLLIVLALVSTFSVARPAQATICFCTPGPPPWTSPVMWGTGATCTQAATSLSNQLTAYANATCGGTGLWCNRTNYITHTCAFAGDTQDGYTKFSCKDNC